MLLTSLVELISSRILKKQLSIPNLQSDLNYGIITIHYLKGLPSTCKVGLFTVMHRVHCKIRHITGIAIRASERLGGGRQETTLPFHVRRNVR